MTSPTGTARINGAFSAQGASWKPHELAVPTNAAASGGAVAALGIRFQRIVRSYSGIDGAACRLRSRA